MYQSSGKLAENLIHTGSDYVHHDLGFFDECISVQPNSAPFQGQYCTVFFDLILATKQQHNEKHNNYSTFDLVINAKEGEPKKHISNFVMPSVGFCLPSTCSARDLRSAVSQRIGYRLVQEKHFSLIAITNENYCYTQDKVTLNAKSIKFDIIAICAL